MTMRFPYSTTDPSQDAFDSLPRLPLRLHADSRVIDVMGLVDSGATVNVLPYTVYGLVRRAGWEDLLPVRRLQGESVYATLGNGAYVSVSRGTHRPQAEGEQ
jgi:hypothetical protein